MCLGDEHGNTLNRFQRRITPTGVSVFSIDNKTTSYDEYVKKLSKYNIRIKARNFLVFQGDVEEVAQKDPKEMTRLFQQISGSDMYEDDCVTAETAKRQLTNEFKFNAVRKGQIETELRELKKQVDEVVIYEGLQQKLKEATIEMYMYKLYCNETLAFIANDTLKNITNEIETKKHHMSDTRTSMGQMDADRAKLQSKITQSETQLKKTRQEMQTLTPESARLNEQIAYTENVHTSKIESKQKASVTRQRLEAYIQQIEEKKTHTQKELDKIRIEYENASKSFKISENDFKEYDTAKQLASTDVANLNTHRDTLKMTYRDINKKITQIQKETEEISGQLKQTSESIDECNDRLTRMHTDITDTQNKISQKEKEAAQLDSQIKKSLQERESLLSEKRVCEEKLYTSQANKKQIDAAQRDRELSDELKTHFAGVYGYLKDLCEPTAMKYTVAVSTALGIYNRHIVVDTFQTAKAVIEYLTRRRYERQSFIPMDNISFKRVDMRLRELRVRSARLAIDCLTFDATYRPVFEFVMADTVVVDNMEDARELAYKHARELQVRVKVVTLDGERISKNGNMAIDTKSSQEALSRWDARQYAACEESLKNVRVKLKKLESVETSETNIVSLYDEIRRLKQGLDSKNIRFNLYNESVKKKNEDKISLENLSSKKKN